MADERNHAISEIVTTFLLNTCRLRPRSASKRDIQAAVCCGVISTGHPANDVDTEFIPLTTGSVAEFYIEPMLAHASDIDLMYHHNTQLAVPRGHPPPTRLPAEFHCYVKVHEITDSHLPGYVYLELHYLLTECSDDGKYNYVEYDRGLYLTSNAYEGDDRNRQIHGPAMFTDNSHTSQLSIDTVHCVRCLSWPPQAADWPTRHRNYGWPDSATLDHVVSNGCDVVGVAHRQCRQDEWMGRRQWRLSFSRAEIVLLNSWIPVQQIVYHILRFFVKTEQLTDSDTLSNYHIKTLMLWACELKPRSWWTENLNLVRICADLLQTLSVWLTDTRCPHYFINSCNLLGLDNSLGWRNGLSIKSVDEEFILSAWLIHNYISQCAQLCQLHILRLFNDVDSSMKLQNAVSEIVRWRLSTSLYDLWWAVKFAEKYIAEQVSAHLLNVRSCVTFVNELTKIDQRLPIYFSAVALLQVACEISRNGFRDELVDILATILGRNFSLLSLHKTELNTSELVELLQKSAVEHLTIFRQLEARDFGSVARIVTTDFEALYAYKRGDYQWCLQLTMRNVSKLLYAVRLSIISTFPLFIQLLDDDIVSLTALTLIVDPECRILIHSSCLH